MTGPKRGPRGTCYGKPLNARELEVLYWIGRGLETADLVEKFHATDGGIRSSIRQAMDKLGAHNRPQAVALGYDKGLIGANRPKPAAVKLVAPCTQTHIPGGLLEEIAAVLRATALGRTSPALNRQAGIALNSLRAYATPSVPAQRTRDSR